MDKIIFLPALHGLVYAMRLLDKLTSKPGVKCQHIHTNWNASEMLLHYGLCIENNFFFEVAQLSVSFIVHQFKNTLYNWYT